MYKRREETYCQCYVQPQHLGKGAGEGCGCPWILSWQPRAKQGLPMEGAAQEDLSGFWSLKCFVLTGIDHAALALLARLDTQAWEGEFSLNHQESMREGLGPKRGKEEPSWGDATFRGHWLS